MEETKEHLKREVGVLGLSANMINIVVGAGIFTLPATVAAGLGPASVFAYLFCGLLIALVMLCFAEVGSKVTTSGGAYAYIESSFGPYFGFLTVILFVLSTVSADAAVANFVVNFLGSIFPAIQLQVVRVLIFMVLFAGLGYVNIRGIKEGIVVVKFITITKLLPLLLLAFFGWSEVSFSNIAINETPGLMEIGKVSLILFFAFQGAESGLSISGEVKNPNRTIPRAIFLSVTGVLILYILIQTVALGVLGDSLATNKDNPLGAAADKIFGPVGFTIMAIGAAVSMFGYLTSEILSIPRVLYSASRDKVLPFKGLAKIHPKFATPHVSIIVYATMGFLFASLGGFEQLAIISSASMLLVYMGVALSVIKLRRMNKTTPANSFKIPGGYLVPILSVVIIAWVLSNLTQNEFIGIGSFIAGLTVIYFIKSKFSKGA